MRSASVARVAREVVCRSVWMTTLLLPLRPWCLRLEEVECSAPDGPQLFVDGVCICMEDLLIANRSGLDRLDELSTTV